LDGEKLKHACLAQQNGFGPALLQSLQSFLRLANGPSTFAEFAEFPEAREWPNTFAEFAEFPEAREWPSPAANPNTCQRRVH
jgi:hypothetical protein